MKNESKGREKKKISKIAKNHPITSFFENSQETRGNNIGVRGEKPPLHGSRNARVERITTCRSVLCNAAPLFSKLFANFDDFLRQRATWRSHSELLICDRDSIFAALSWYSSISLQRHQNFAPAATFLIRMIKSVKMYTCTTIRKFCEKSGPFSGGFARAGGFYWIFMFFSIKIIKIQWIWALGQLGCLQIAPKSFIQTFWDSAGARLSSGRARPLWQLQDWLARSPNPGPPHSYHRQVCYFIYIVSETPFDLQKIFQKSGKPPKSRKYMTLPPRFF